MRPVLPRGQRTIARDPGSMQSMSPLDRHELISPLERALVVVSHPDDAEFGAGPTIAWLTAAGVRVGPPCLPAVGRVAAELPLPALLPVVAVLALVAVLPVLAVLAVLAVLGLGEVGLLAGTVLDADDPHRAAPRARQRAADTLAVVGDRGVGV